MSFSGARSFVLLVLAALVINACTSSVRGSELASEYYNLGNAYYDLGNYDKAVLLFQKAISIDKENRKAFFNLALSLIAADRAGEAQGVLEDLLLQDPDNQSLRETLAFTYHIRGDSERAIEMYQGIIAAYPQSVKARYNLGMLFWELGNREAALEAFVVLSENNPEDLEALYNRGRLLLELDRSEEAVEVLERYLQSKPDRAEPYMLLGQGYRFLEIYDKSLNAYAEALIYDENLAEAWYYSALIQLTKIEDPERGLTALSEALDAGFDDEQLIAGLLGSEELLEREKVETLLEARSLLPETQAGDGQ